MAGRHNKSSHEVAFSLVKSICHRWTWFSKAVEFTGYVASYTNWLAARGLATGARCRTRTQLWQKASDKLQSGKVTVLEFGVANGDGTRIWLSMVPNPELRWHGFDTFTGLPQAWTRGGVVFAEVGAYNAGGAPPDIADPRVTWHAGLVEKTLPDAAIDFEPPLLVLFDLDLYEPSAFALRWLIPHLKPGDLLYFDEAFDPWHERRLLDEFLDSGHRVRAIGSNHVGLMLEYEGPPVNPAD